MSTIPFPAQITPVSKFIYDAPYYGLCVIPADAAKVPRPHPLSSWKELQQRFATAEEISSWISQNPSHCAIVCGAISGGLLCFDFDIKNDNTKMYFPKFITRIIEECPSLYSKLLIEMTPSGGFHIYFRCQNYGRNRKLVLPAIGNNAIVETRAEGGVALCTPSPGYTWMSGATINYLDDQETFQIYDLLIATANDLGMRWTPDEENLKSLNLSPQSPMDDFNKRGECIPLLKKHGWSVLSPNSDGSTDFTRPEKENGRSARYNYGGKRRLHVYSTSTPFEPIPTSHSPSDIFTILECGGDKQLAAQKLMALGFGQPQSVHGNWPEPKPIQSKLTQLPDILPHFLPRPFAPYLINIASNRRSPLIVPAIAALVAAGAAVKRRFAVQPKVNDPSIEFLNIWGMIVGGPGLAKTPCIEAALIGIRELDTAAEGRPVSTMFDPLDPHSRVAIMRYLINDATAAALVEILIHSRGGILYHQDEIPALLSQIKTLEGKLLKSILMTGWNGITPLILERIIRGHRKLRPYVISALGGIQPAQFEHYFLKDSDTVAGGDGFLQRFTLLAAPQPIGHTEYTDLAIPQSVQTAYIDAFRNLAFQSNGSKFDNDSAPLVLRFDSYAQALYIDWWNNLFKSLSTNAYPPALDGMYRKYPKALSALAGITQLLDEPGSTSIGQGSFEKALNILNTVKCHAEFVLSGNPVIESECDTAKRLFQKLLTAFTDDKFTSHEIRTKCWSGLTDSKTIDKAIEILECHNWVVRLSSPSSSRGGRPTTHYCLNPKARLAAA